MNRNATHTSTDHSKGNDLKGCAMHSTQPSISSLAPCPFPGRPSHPVIVGTSFHQRAPLLPSLRAKRSNPNLGKNNAVPSSNPTMIERNNMKWVAPHPLTKSTCRAFHTVALAGLFTLAFINPATAADFPGILKGATITDAQTTNQPPVAVFTYAIDGDTVTFDASGSSDPDGNITKYKWDFGNGTTNAGVTANYSIANTPGLQVTLTVFDNNEGVAVTQKFIGNSCQLSSDYNNIEFYQNRGDMFGNRGFGGSWTQSVDGNDLNISFYLGEKNGTASPYFMRIDDDANPSNGYIAEKVLEIKANAGEMQTVTFNGVSLKAEKIYYWFILGTSATYGNHISSGVSVNPAKAFNYYETSTGWSGYQLVTRQWTGTVQTCK